jgi:hypothetical protein
MLFSTPPYEQHNQLPIEVKEKNHLWALQSTTTMEFSTHDGCFAAGLRIYNQILPVGNMTFKGICLCESTDPGKKCPSTPADEKTINFMKKSPKFLPLVGERPTIGSDVIAPPR